MQWLDRLFGALGPSLTRLPRPFRHPAPAPCLALATTGK
ncbi:hypothetical protein PCLA_12r0336 [Pseudomonas citronellolis]|nr:hypothetical protein PCLA_12r0336 [Pseudomonas citronellolis]